MPNVASALPRKHFFREMFTRDISLEDCILDLIDNSIDALVKSKNVDIATAVLKGKQPQPDMEGLPWVKVSFTEKAFTISDNCGGIAYDDAENDIFNFGHGSDSVKGQLGAYGIGLKRAIFKIGNDFQIESHTDGDGFVSHLADVRQWAEKDESIEDWCIPIKKLGGRADGGTKIVIKDLRDEVKMRLKDGTVEGRLLTLISQTYAFYLKRYIRVYLNDKLVEPTIIPIGSSNDVTPAHDEFQEGDVKVTLFASLYSPPKAETAGWYVLCNGRVVLQADKTELTGWGPVMAQFHTKYTRFVGLAFFQSRNPLALPWTTTKRGLNRESAVFQHARNRMIGMSQPILKFLNNMYPSDLAEKPLERQIADTIKPTDVRTVARGPQTEFRVHIPKQTRPTSVRVQFDAAIEDLDRVRKHLRRPSMPANKVGRHTFDHFLKTECPS